MNRSYTDDMNSSPPNYLTTRTFRIVRLFAIIFALLLVAYSLFLSTLKTGAIPDHTSTAALVRRARWSFATGLGLGGFVIAAAAYATPYWVAAICIASTGGVCSPIAGAVLATSTVIVAAVLVGKSSGSATKRGLSKTISVLNHTITFTDHVLNGQTLSNGTSSNFVTIGFSGYAVHDTIKRDGAAELNFVGYTTEHGTHISTSSVHNVSMLIDQIVAVVPGVPDISGNASALSLQRRSQEFATSWISMTYSQSYGDLAQNWQNDEGGAGNFDSYAEEELQNFFSGNRDWKYCFAAEDTKNGEPLDYDDIPGDGAGTGSAFKSEIYFNTYGGIDNYCNDEHIGAQNTGDGR